MGCVLLLPLLCLEVTTHWSQHILTWDAESLAQVTEVGALNETYLLSLV